MPHLNIAQRNALKFALEELRGELKAAIEVGAEAGAPVELDQSRVGRLSRMDAMQGQAMAKASTARQKNQLQRAESTLLRIDSPDYGECSDCGETIPFARLEFDPTVSCCVACAEEREQG